MMWILYFVISPSLDQRWNLVSPRSSLPLLVLLQGVGFGGHRRGNWHRGEIPPWTFRSGHDSRGRQSRWSSSDGLCSPRVLWRRLQHRRIGSIHRTRTVDFQLTGCRKSCQCGSLNPRLACGVVRSSHSSASLVSSVPNIRQLFPKLFIAEV